LTESVFFGKVIVDTLSLEEDMLLSLEMRLTIRQSLDHVGGATESIFPEVESVLLAGTDYSSAIFFVANKKNVYRYWSLMDFLFCELHNKRWRRRCVRFYAGVGPRLGELITLDELAEFNLRLLSALEIARKCLDEQRRKDWKWFRQLLDDTMRAA
jgi:hypothetical protein